MRKNRLEKSKTIIAKFSISFPYLIMRFNMNTTGKITENTKLKDKTFLCQMQKKKAEKSREYLVLIADEANSNSYITVYSLKVEGIFTIYLVVFLSYLKQYSCLT